MANYALKTTVLTFLIFLWLLAVLEPVHARGRQDIDLSTADALIDEKQYDQAIQVLTEYARRYPQRFDHAQQRLRRIAQIREQFNRTADELIQTLLNDPNNDEKILDLTIRLSELEEDTSPIMMAFIARTHEIANFNVNRNRLRDILERGRGALDRGEATTAMQIYASGMGLMRNEFFAAGFGNAIETEVIVGTDRVNTVLDSFQSLSGSLGRLSAELIAAINAGNIPLAQNITARLVPEMDAFFGLQQELVRSANSFDSILEEIRAADPEVGDRNHLAFFTRVIYGRPGDVQEGMLGVFETYWDASIRPIVAAITENADRTNVAGLLAFNTGNFTNATTTLQRAINFVDLSDVFFERHISYNEGGRMSIIDLFDDRVLYTDLQSYTELRAISEASSHLIQANVFAERIGSITTDSSNTLALWNAGTISTVTALNNERQTRDIIFGIRDEVDAIVDSANQADEIIKEYHQVDQIREAITAIETLFATLHAREIETTYTFYYIANSDLWRSVEERKSEFEAGRILFEGERFTRDDGLVVIDYYPSEALEILTAALARLDINIEQGNEYIESQSNEREYVRNNVEIAKVFTDTEAVVKELNSLRNQTFAMAETARQQSAQAFAHRQDAERLFREAQNAFAARDFDTAKDRLQRSQERINSSLSVQASAPLREQWDNQLMALGRQINAAENQWVIAEVRTLVNRARESYFAGNFQSAEDSLIRARNMWRITNVDENQEVMHWLGIVRSAMSARSGRVIPVTAPLYPEMSQLLSEARRNFEEGVRHINAGRRTQGLARFEEAHQQTREVRLLYPLNQEAGILELRMEQFTDPVAFNAAFQERLVTARNGIRNNRSMESFADLLNLAEINPSYPGIRGMITQAEIDMGFRPPPPNPADLSRSRELTASANRILDSNNATMFEVALTQINEAITLNPENIEATRVKDQLLSRMHLPTGVVLSNEDEAEYQRAVREFSAGNNLVALAIVQRLLQNPQNRAIPKVVDLERRIRAVL